MGREAVAVKSRRRYDASGRRAQAARTRAAVLDAAERRLLADGFAATTIASIAAEAGVSPETVYKGFGGKPGLVRAIRDRALEGAQPVPAEQRSEELRLRETDPHVIVHGWGMLTAELAPRGAPILLLVRDAAAVQPEMADLLRELDDDRRRRMAHNAEFLAEHGYLRADVSVEHARDVMWAYSSAELFELLVLRQGWSPERYGAFVGDALAAALLD
jgi:AcrR family transcriptional regulator